jgi:heme-degrading monooxygenase HmoA
MDGRQADLEVVFGKAGIWSELLRRAEGYAGTEIWCESSAERRYRVLDFWRSHREFELFRARFVAERERFHSLLISGGIVSKFEVVGTYYDERGDGDDLVAT